MVRLAGESAHWRSFTIRHPVGIDGSQFLKPDPQTPISGGVVLARMFEEAGLPPGVFSVVNGGAIVVSRPAVNFTSAG